jgi:phosphate-selective porin
MKHLLAFLLLALAPVAAHAAPNTNCHQMDGVRTLPDSRAFEGCLAVLALLDNPEIVRATYSEYNLELYLGGQYDSGFLLFKGNQSLVACNTQDGAIQWFNRITFSVQSEDGVNVISVGTDCVY